MVQSSANSWRELVVATATPAGIRLTERQLERVLHYIELLHKWNQRINLVGATEIPDIIAYHVLDCLHLTHHLPTDTGRLIDVGSGAGLPAIPIAIIRPDIEVTALEPIRKKHAFLSTVRRELELSNCIPRPCRLDEYCASDYFRPHDAAVSRATFAPQEWISRARNLVRPDGRILAMEGSSEIVLPEGATRYRYELNSPIPSNRAAPRKRAIIVLTSS